MSLYGAIVTALYQRTRTGKGGHVSSHLMANGVWSNGFMVQAKLCGSTIIDRPPRESLPNALSNHYRCRDGRWLILSLLSEERQWPALAAGLGREDLMTDPRFAETAGRHRHAVELIAILDEVFALKDLADWRAILDARGLTFGITAMLDDMPTDEQMRVTETFVPFEGDTMLTINSPFWVGGVNKVSPRRAPALGGDTDRVLQAAGYRDDEVVALRAAGVVGGATSSSR
jgi:formyl-CoA transferase